MIPLPLLALVFQGPPASAPSEILIPGTPRWELSKLVEAIKKDVPKGEGIDSEAARRSYFLASRAKLEEFARANGESDEAHQAHIFRATLSLAAGAPDDAAAELEEIAKKLVTATEGAPLRTRMETLRWLVEADAGRALPYLAEAEKLPFGTGDEARKLSQRAQAKTRLKVGAPAVAFSAHDVAGRAVSPDAFRGKVLVLHFWSSASKESLREVQEWKRAYAKLHGAGLEIVGVSLDGAKIRSVPGGGEPAGDGVAGIARFAADSEMPWPIVYDGRGVDGELALLHSVARAPSSIVIDRDGKYRLTGATAADAIAAVNGMISSPPK